MTNLHLECRRAARTIAGLTDPTLLTRGPVDPTRLDEAAEERPGAVRVLVGGVGADVALPRDAGSPARQVSDQPGRLGVVDQDEVAIIDLDSAYCGDPADDLGKFVAQLGHLAVRADLDARRVAVLRDAVLDGYRRVAGALPARLGLYTAAALLRRARFPFQTREPDWPQRTEALLHRAEAFAEARDDGDDPT